MGSELPPVGVVDAWALGAEVGPVRLRDGLINPTWRLDGPSGPVGVLQELNLRVFRPEVHEDIEAVTAHLDRAGLLTPRLRRTRAGGLWHTTADGRVFRVLSWVGSRTVHVATPALAGSAGALVARFHAAVADLDWTFRHVRVGAHDTDRHAGRLRAALAAHDGHRLGPEVRPLADAVLRAWDDLRPSMPVLPTRVVHGDLKISNVRFDDAGEAVALIDLDTFARDTLGAELGDALRSWCGTAGEDAAEASFDLEVFEAAMAGYASGAGDRGPSADEWAAVVPSVARIALELAMRFATDALEESYFGWDEARFATRGDHNLVRARGQAALAAAVHRARTEAERRLARARERRS